MLTEQECEEIRAKFVEYEDKHCACLDALQIVQRHRRWISDESLIDVAQFLEMDPAELDGVATFYNLIFRQPVGRHVIMLCDSVACWVMGYVGVREHLKSRLEVDLGETTADDRFTLLPIVCLGACEQAPAMLVDGKLYGHLDAEEIERVLALYP